MNLYQARDLAKSLMREHGLEGWTFEFDHARRRFGQCCYDRRRITLSRPLTLLNGELEVRDTILHEIAHALTPGDGHGLRWKAACQRVGARPVRCFREEAVAMPPRTPARYRFGCGRCGWWVDRRRRTNRRYRCTRCGGEVVLREKHDPAIAHQPVYRSVVA